MPASDVIIKAEFEPDKKEDLDSFVIVSVRDVRWKDYFVSSGEETHKYIKIPAGIGSAGVLLQKAKLIADSRSNRDVAYGYAVETQLRTEGISINDSQIKVTYELYDEKGPIELKSADKKKYLTLQFGKNGDESHMASVKTVEGQKYETLNWTWVFYLPMDVMDKYNDLLYEQYDKVTVKYNIEILDKNGKSIYNYVKAQNTTNETDWGGRVFTYRTDKTVMTDIYNNATN
jgi:hypothetical protein